MNKLLYGIGGVVLLLLIIGYVLPAETRLVVSADINAPRATVFALVNDLHRHRLWSDIIASDAHTELVFSGSVRGVGASLSWDGATAGSGTQTITASQAFERVETRINPGEPGEAQSWFQLSDAGGRTHLRWGFEHKHGANVVGRYVGVIAGGVIRSDYERSIANLKELAESLPGEDFSDLELAETVVPAIPIAYKSARSAPDSASLSEALGDAYFDVLEFMDSNALALAGPPVSIARANTGTELRFDAGLPVRGVTDATPTAAGAIKLGETYAGTVLKVRHIGSYQLLGETHRKIAAYLTVLGIERNGDAWEEYVSDPADVDEDELITEIYYPIRPL